MILRDTYTIYMRKNLHSTEYLRLRDYSNKITYKILRAFTCMIYIIQDREEENRTRNKVKKEETFIWKVICSSYILCFYNYQSSVIVRVEFPFRAGSDRSVIGSVCLRFSSAT